LNFFTGKLLFKSLPLNSDIIIFKLIFTDQLLKSTTYSKQDFKTIFLVAKNGDLKEAPIFMLGENVTHFNKKF